MEVLDLPLLEYEQALKLQFTLRDRRIADEISDILIVLEHPPVITLGRSGNMSNLRVSKTVLNSEGIAFFHSSRGGDITYHGPGQIIGYPILDIKPYGFDLRRHLWRIEEVLIDTLKAWSIEGSRRDRCTGVWVGEEKIGSIGLHIKRGVTMHGFSLNVNPTMEHLSLIYPCGIRDNPMTSMEQLLETKISNGEVRSQIVTSFGNIFHVNMTRSKSSLVLPDLNIV